MITDSNPLQFNKWMKRRLDGDCDRQGLAPTLSLVVLFTLWEKHLHFPRLGSFRKQLIITFYK